jgi:hypothetical protein
VSRIVSGTPIRLTDPFACGVHLNPLNVVPLSCEPGGR